MAGTFGEPFKDGWGPDVWGGGGGEIVAPVVEGDGGGGGAAADGFGRGGDEGDTETWLGGKEGGELGEEMGTNAADT